MGNGKTALVTGGASGLGKDLALALHAQGATIVVADKNESAGAAFAAELNQKRSKSAYFKQVDVTKWDEQVELFKYVVSTLERVDYVFANAGIAESPFLPKPSTTVLYTKPDLATIDIDLIGVLYTSHLAVQVFRAQQVVNGFRGKVVVTGSVASFVAVKYMPLYCTAKAAVVNFVRSLAKEVASENITINAVCPNITRTNFAPSPLFDIIEKHGWLTANKAVTDAFLSFLGDNTSNGEALEVSTDTTQTRAPYEYLNQAVGGNVATLEEIGRQKRAAASTQ